MKKIKKGLLMAFMGVLLLLVTACAPSEVVQNNLSKEAEKFNVYRKATIINLVSDNVLLEVEGYFSMEKSASGALAIVIRTGKDEYKMHYIYQDATIHVVTLVEQLENTNTNQYHWNITIYAVKPQFQGGGNDHE